MGLISWYEPLCNGNGNQVIYGIAEELIKLSIKYGFENLTPKWGGEGLTSIKTERYATNYSPTVFSLALDEFVRENGVDIRFDRLFNTNVNTALCTFKYNLGLAVVLADYKR